MLTAAITPIVVTELAYVLAYSAGVAVLALYCAYRAVAAAWDYCRARSFRLMKFRNSIGSRAVSAH